MGLEVNRHRNFVCLLDCFTQETINLLDGKDSY